MADQRPRGRPGDSAWIGVAAAVAATFVAGKVLRRHPFGALASLLVPIVIAKFRGREPVKRDQDKH
jgi:ATP/ADP translocase